MGAERKEKVIHRGAVKNAAGAASCPFSLRAAARARVSEGGRESRVQEGTLQSVADAAVAAVAAAAAATSQSTFEASGGEAAVQSIFLTAGV